MARDVEAQPVEVVRGDIAVPLQLSGASPQLPRASCPATGDELEACLTKYLEYVQDEMLLHLMT